MNKYFFLYLYIFIVCLCSISCRSNSSSGDSKNQCPDGNDPISISSGRGNFTISDNTISFLVHALNKENQTPIFEEFKNPLGEQENSILDPGGFGWRTTNYSNIFFPLSDNQSYQVRIGTWNFKVKDSELNCLTTRSGTISDIPRIKVQPYISGSSFTSDSIIPALEIMKSIYSNNGVTLDVHETITLEESKFTKVSPDFTNKITSEMVSKGDKDKVNLFFITDYSDKTSYLGNAAGIPGSQGLKGSHNGVLINLSAHKTGENLDDQLLGETAGHEMGHFLGLFHPSESKAKYFDPITDKPENYFDPIADTPECTSGQISTLDCENQGANNLMFWTAYSILEKNNGKKQDNLTEGQVYVLKRALIAK